LIDCAGFASNRTMRDEPPPELADLLARLHLATAEQVAAAGRYARRMAGDLPLFDSVWIDAFLQSRLLTPNQAAEINAGRGQQLLVGPYVIRHTLGNLGYAQSFTAWEIHHHETEPTPKSRRNVQLVVKRFCSASSAEQAAAKLQSMIARFAEFKPSTIAPLTAAGADGNSLWAAFEAVDGFPVGEMVACSGRIAPGAAMEIAWQMAAALEGLHQAGLVHGDISARSLWLNAHGEIRLTYCGVRGVMESDANGQSETFPLEAFDYLAPERMSGKSPPTMATDIYACGCLWWHLLGGRPPLVGGDLIGKTRAVSRPKIANIRHIAPDTPESLAAAIEACTRIDPAQRPVSFTELAEKLGLPSRGATRRLAAKLAASGHQIRHSSGWKTQLRWQHAGQPLLATAACLFLLAAATWPLWRSRHPANRPLGTKEAAIAQVEANRPTTRPLNPDRGKDTPHAAAANNPQRDVRQVNYQTIDETPVSTGEIASTAKENPIVELTCDTEINGATLRLQSGTTMRGVGKKRPQIVTPPNGLVIAVDQVRFENVDFIWRQRAEEITSPERHALVDVRAPHAEFVGCTFQALSIGTFELPVAIRLSDNRNQRSAALAPAVRVKLEHSALQGVACAIDCHMTGPAAINLLDVLHLGHGSLICFSQSRPADAPTAIGLDHVTARGMPAVLQFEHDETADHSGAITVTATACVFAPDENGALICCNGQRSLIAVSSSLKSLEWAGQGSLVSPDMPVAIWQRGAKKEPAPEADVTLEGLVAAAFDFAGPATANPATSRLRRWLAPQKTDEPPGISDAVPAFPAINNRSGQF
jgi:eukaryotic-like serine/threonine-protein kinase